MFASNASNLVAGDTNGSWDVFLHDLACGDGVTTGLEECDDGGNVDGDGCDANCTVSECGNGRRTGNEACDAGAANGADGCCSSTGTLEDGDGICDAFDRCTAPAASSNLLVLSGLLSTNEATLNVRGKATFPSPVVPALDPSANGVRLLLLDGLDHVALDLPIAGGPPWVANASGTAWAFKSPALDVKIRHRAGSGLVKFKLRAKNLTIARGATPYAATIFLQPPDAALGQCSDVRIACVAGASGDRVRCR